MNPESLRILTLAREIHAAKPAEHRERQWWKPPHACQSCERQARHELEDAPAVSETVTHG